MKLERVYIVFMMLVLTILASSCVCASDADSISASDVSSIGVNDTVVIEDSLFASDNSADGQLLEDSGEIEVNDWTELRDYCSLDDKNYVLKLKENTNYYPEDPTSDEYQIIVKNNVTIKGSSGSYIGDSSPNARPINFMPMTVNDNSGIGIVLQDITFKWINTEYSPDGVFITMAGNVNNTIKNCNFYNITTNMGHSSILHIKYGSLYVENCTFINCTTNYGCISVYSPKDDSTKICTGARMDIADSYFEGNYAKTEPGCINNCGILNVYNTTFYKNSAFWWAGAIHTHGGANTTIYDSNFTDNVAGWNGGALYTYSYLQIYNSTFEGNNCTTNNGGGAIGACKYLHSPYIYIDGCIFRNNENLCWGLSELSTSGTGRGGAISFMDEGSLEVYNSKFIENAASIGTAICAVAAGQYGSPSIKIIGNEFINHTRVGDVLKITLSPNSECEIKDNYYFSNSIEFLKLKLDASDPVDGKVTFYIDPVLKNPDSYDSDILQKSKYDIYVDGVYNSSVSSLSFSLNFQKGETHRVYVVPSISNSKSNEVLAGLARTYIYVSQKSGKDTNDGLTRNTPVATLNKSIELARSHENIIIMDGTFKETNLVIDYNLTITGEKDVTITSKGLIFTIADGDVNFKNIIFKNSKSSDKGKTKEKIIKQESSGFLILDNCIFENNEYSSLIESSGSVECKNLKFISNGAALIKSNSVSIYDSLFIFNNAISTNYDSLIFPSSKTVKFKITNSTFRENNVCKGCIRANDLNTEIVNCNFESNAGSSKSSCIYNDGGTIIITSSSFINNTDTAESSFIYASKGTTVIVESIILNNYYVNSKGIINGNPAGLKLVTCNYNWWGNTLDNLEKPQLDSSINCNNWLVLNATSSHELLGMGEVATVIFDLNYMVDNENNISIYYSDNLPQFDLFIQTVNGNSVDKVRLVNSRAQVPFELIKFSQASLTASYENVEVTVDFYVTQIDPNFIIDVEDIRFGEIANITVTTSSNIASIDVSIGSQNYTLNFVDGVSQINIPSLSSGIHNVSINYPGSSIYLPSQVNKSFEVFKIEPNAYINVNNVYYGGDVKITFNIDEDASGSAILTLNGNQQTELINHGKAEFILSNLNSGSYNFGIDYSGDEKYLSNECYGGFTVYKYSSSVNLDVGELKLGEDVFLTVFLKEDAKGNVTFIINGNSVTVDVNDSKATYTIKKILKGDYYVEAVYNGDEKYLSSKNSTQFTIGKLPSFVEVKVNDIQYGKDAIVEITTTPIVSGNVTITIDDISETVQLINGKSVVNISNLKAGDKELKVSYNGNDDYLPSENYTAFKISKINSSFSISANSTMVGNDVVVKIDFNKDMTGNFTYKLGNESKTYAISKVATVNNWNLKKLKPGNYTVTVIYSGDNNYNSDSNYTEFVIGEYPKPQVSNEGIDTKNTDKSPFEGDVNGKILHIVELENKINGSIVVDNNGNIYFASNNQLFAYSSLGELIWNYSSSFDGGSSFSGVSIGRDLLISPMNGDRLYFINITAGKENVHSNLMGGSSLFSPIIDENYTIYIVSEYQHSNSQYNLVIIPYDIWETSLTPTMIGIGSSKPLCAPIIVDDENVAIVSEDGLKLINIKTSNVASIGYVSPSARPVVGFGGIVYAFSGDSIIAIQNQQQQWKTKVTGGIGKYLALDSELGNIYSVNENGVLYKYDVGFGEESFIYDFNEKVSSNVLIDNDGNLYVGTESGKLYSFDSDGHLLWKVNLNATINGNPVMDSEGLIYVIVNGSELVKLGSGQLQDSNFKVTADNITIGDDLIIKIIFGDETGNISVKINNALYSVLSIGTDGKSALTIPDLPSGNYTAEITYHGDKRFKQSIQTIQFSVFKRNIENIDDVIDIPQSDDVQNLSYSINLENATGNLTVVVDGEVYSCVDLVNGSASIDVKDLPSGSHSVEVIYSGDSRYAPISRNVTVNVAEPVIPHVPVVKVVGSDVSMLYTSGAKYNVRVTSDGKPVSGKTVNFVVNGVKLTAKTDKEGYASVKIDLPPKSSKYTVTATYNGVKVTNKVKVNGIVSAKNVKVKKSAKQLKIKVTLKKVNGKYIKSKKVTLKFKGKKYTAKTNKKGVASFNIPKKVIKKLKKGKKYTYKATYLKQTVSKKVTVK